MKGIVNVPSKPVKKKRDRTQPVNWYAPEEVHDLAYWQARAEAADNSREMRAGRHLLKTARELGWQDDGEGAQEFIMRKCYEQGKEDKP